MPEIDELVVAIDLETKEMRKEINKIGKHFDKLDRDISKKSKSMNLSFATMAKGAAALGAALVAVGVASKLKDLAVDTVKTTASFETLTMALKTATGSSERANAVFDQLLDYANQTPSQVGEITEAYIKLKNLGLDPSIESLRSYGNTAAAQAKPLMQMIEAVADASTGEFERLKEFGIKASSEGDRVTFTFQNVATEVEKNAEEIQQYLLDIGNTKFASAMSDQAGTLNVKFSNLEGAANKLKKAFGEETGLNSTIKDAVDWFTQLINKTEKYYRMSAETELDLLQKQFDANEERINQLQKERGGIWDFLVGKTSEYVALTEQQITLKPKIAALEKEIAESTKKKLQDEKEYNEEQEKINEAAEKEKKKQEEIKRINKRKKELAKDYKKILEDSLTPTQELNAEIKKVEEMLSLGVGKADVLKDKLNSLKEELILMEFDIGENIVVDSKAYEEWEENHKKFLEDMKEAHDDFKDTFESTFADELSNIMKGNFDDIGSAFGSLIQRMIAEALAANITDALFSGSKPGGGGVLNFIGGVLGFAGGTDPGPAPGAGVSTTPNITTTPLLRSADKPIVNVFNNANNTEVQIQTRTTADGKNEINAYVVEAVKHNMQTGMFDVDMAANYGVRRIGGV